MGAGGDEAIFTRTAFNFASRRSVGAGGGLPPVSLLSLPRLCNGNNLQVRGMIYCKTAHFCVTVKTP